MQDGQKEFQCCLHYLILVALQRAGGCRGTKMQDRGRRSHVLCRACGVDEHMLGRVMFKLLCFPANQ